MHGLTEDEVLLLLRSLIPAELSGARGQRSEPPDPGAITADTRIDDAPIRADSLDRLTVASALNRFFSLHETGVEDRLLALRGIGDMAELIRDASASASGLVFTTSGSTGDPQPHHHGWAAIRQEAEALAEAFSGYRRVIAWLPLHHLYGFMNGIALARQLDAELIDAPAAPSTLFRDLRPGDLIVTVPARWRYLRDSGMRFPEGTGGVSSTAPLDSDIVQGLLDAGLGALTEVYGATETGGIGLRTAPESGYRLLPYWEPADEGHLRRVLPDGERRTVTPLDHLEWLDARTFRPAGRIDDLIQVGGVNVSPGHVAERLRQHPRVADSAVRPHGEGSSQRLKAFIVPADPEVDHDALRQEIEAWAWENLPAVERPTRITLGDALPRNEMGKLQDWD